MAAPRRGGGGGERRERRDDRRGGADKGTAYLERVVTINRVAKVVQGGRRFSFTALVVVGDGNGMVGVGYGKAKEVPAAIAKGVEAAKKNFFRVPRIGGTIPHAITARAAAGMVLLKPASPGTGVIAGGPVRAVLECAGIHDVLSRSLGSSNAINVVHATVAALKGLNRPEEIAARRGLPIEDVAPAAMLRARRDAAAAASAAAGVVLLKPASPGTGVIAGGPVRAVLECAGVHDVLSRSLGSSNAINVVHATVAALKGLSRPEEIAARRGLPIEHVAPAAMLRARDAAAAASAATGTS